MTSTVDNSEWWAYVRYVDDQEREEIQVKYITTKVKVTKENGFTKKKRLPFNPQHLEDFDRKQTYSVHTKMGSADGDAHWHYAQIGKLAEKQEDLQIRGRGYRTLFEPLGQDGDYSEDFTTDAEMGGGGEGCSGQETVSQRRKRRQEALHDVQTEALRREGMLKYAEHEPVEEHSDNANGCGSTSADSAATIAELQRKLRKSEEEKEALLQSRRREEADQAAILAEVRLLKECYESQLRELNLMSGRINGLDEKMDEVLSEFIGPPDYVSNWLRLHF